MLRYTVRIGERSLGDGDMLNQDGKIEIGYNWKVSETAASSQPLLPMHERVENASSVASI